MEYSLITLLVLRGPPLTDNKADQPEINRLLHVALVCAESGTFDPTVVRVTGRLFHLSQSQAAAGVFLFLPLPPPAVCLGLVGAGGGAGGRITTRLSPE